MIFNVLSLFPEQVECYFKSSIIYRAIKKGLVDIKYWQLRDFSVDKYHKVDDSPYGGGKGMVLKTDVVDRALEEIKDQKSKIKNVIECHSGIRRQARYPESIQIDKNLSWIPHHQSRRDRASTEVRDDRKIDKNANPYVILTSPKGKRFDQKIAKRLSKKKNLVLICGHYEGFDARVEKLVDETISLGDFVMSGGEIAAAAIIDSVARLIPGVLAKGSLKEESFNIGKNFEYPQYTKPERFIPKSIESKELVVPKVLLTGNHQEIKKWRERKNK